MRASSLHRRAERSIVVAESHEEVGVLGVDDQPFFLDVVREVVVATSGFRWLGGASSGEDALGAVDELHPALVLLDVRMPDMDGLETARRIRDRHPDVVVVLVSVELTAATPRAVTASGAAALVRKQEFGPSALRRLWRAYAGSAGKPAANPRPGSGG
jgi:DNA-binding NarL/FixJ family response regulator